MQRLKTRRLRLLSRDYLVYRALWPAIEQAVAQAMAHALASGTPVQGRQDLVVVDVGCGERPYADLFGPAFYIGIDRSREGARPSLIADALRLPLAGGSADIVFCTQVIEHVTEPPQLLGECRRILKPGGALVLTGPFYWPLHEEPHDYYRFTCHGFAHLLRCQGFLHIEVRPDCGAVTQAAVAVIEALPRWCRGLVPVINAITPLLQRGSADRRSTLNYVITARAPP